MQTNFFTTNCSEQKTAPSLFDKDAIESKIKSLSLKEKIGQLFIVAATSNPDYANEAPTPKFPYNVKTEYIKMLIQNHHIGGIIFFRPSTPEKQVAATNEFQKLSNIPLFIALDAEWGLSMRLQETIKFPRNGAFEKVENTDLIYQLGKEIGRQLTLIGVHMNLAPVVDINNNPQNPVIGDRSFGDNPQLVTQKSIAYMQGLLDSGIIACAKHFPGHGDTTVDSHEDLPVINHTRDHLDAIELYPFKQLIEKQVPAIMTAHLAVPALEPNLQVPTSLSYNTTTNFLKNELGFKGLVITDGLGMQGVSKYYEPGHIELNAFLAGNDILLCPLDVPKASMLIENAITQGIISEQELDSRVMKIMLAKAWAFAQNPLALNPVYDQQQLHTPAAYLLQKNIYDACKLDIPTN